VGSTVFFLTGTITEKSLVINSASCDTSATTIYDTATTQVMVLVAIGPVGCESSSNVLLPLWSLSSIPLLLYFAISIFGDTDVRVAFRRY